MSNKKTMIVTVCVTALITCFLTNIVRDIMFVQNNGKIMQKMQRVAGLLTRYSLYDIDADKLSDYAALGMTLSVDDPYTNYYDAEQFDSYSTNIQNSYVGLGLVLAVDTEKNKIVVVSPYEDGPAAKAGILAGDFIVAADGEQCNAENFEEVVKKMRGYDIEEKVGTSAILTIQRGEDSEPFDVQVMRESVMKNTVKAKMLDNSVGYMRITGFDSKDTNDENAKDTFDEFQEQLTDLKDNQGMEKLIIDLRDNPGGDLSVATKIADMLLPQGIITYTEDRNGKKSEIYSDSKELGLPMAVLVNEGSASASEVLTGALKDFEKAVIVGKKTYGKGIVQTIYPLGDGSGVSITTSKYFSPNGVCIHDIGIEPDENVSLTNDEKPISELTYEEDLQLQKACELLEKK